MQPIMQIVLPVFMARNLPTTGGEIKNNAASPAPGYKKDGRAGRPSCFGGVGNSVLFGAERLVALAAGGAHGLHG